MQTNGLLGCFERCLAIIWATFRGVWQLFGLLLEVFGNYFVTRGLRPLSGATTDLQRPLLLTPCEVPWPSK